MKAVLASHNLITPEAPLYFGLGLHLLKAATEADPELQDVDIRLMDRSVLDRSYADVIAAEPADVYGLSCQCWNLDTHLALAGRLKREHPKATIVLGGSSTVALDGETFTRHPGVDVIVEGEGEAAWPAILKALKAGEPLHTIPGVRTRDGHTPIGPGLTSLPLAPEPLQRPLSTFYMLESMRGCIYACDYCHWWIGQRGVRYYPHEHIVSQLQGALKAGYEKVWLIDAAVNFSTPRLASLAAAVREADPAKQLKFWYFLQWNQFDEKQLPHLEAFGVDTIHIGLESINPEALAQVGRKFDKEKFERCVAAVKQIAIPVVDLVLGLPGDTPDGFRRTLDYLLGLDVNVLCFRLVLYPGSALWSRREELGMSVRPGAVPFLKSSPAFTENELDELTAKVGNLAFRDAATGRYFLYEPIDYWEGGQGLV